MKTKNRKTLPILLVVVIVLMLLPGLACNLFSAQPGEPEVVEEPVVVEEPEVIEEPEPEEEPAFRPEQVLRLDFEEKVSSVAFSNDGELFATGVFNQADIWRADDGSLVQSIEAPMAIHTVEGLAFLPGDDVIVLAVRSGPTIFDISSGEQRLGFDHNNFEPMIALSPDGTRIASGNRSGLIFLWDADTGEQIFGMDPGDYYDGLSDWSMSKAITALAYSPDGSQVASGHNGGMIFIWNAETGALDRMIEPETDYCMPDGLAFSSDGGILIVAGARADWDEVIRFYQVSDGSIVRDLDHGTRGGTMASPVVYSPDDALLAFGATDGIYIWSLPDYELLHTIPIEDTGDSDWVTDLAFSPDSQYLLAGYWNDYAILWQVQE